MADFLASQLFPGRLGRTPLSIDMDRGGKDARCLGATLEFKAGSVPFGGGVYSDDELVLAWTGRLRSYGKLADRLGVSPDPNLIVPAAWKRFGPETPAHLEGVLAAVVWDGRDGTWRVFRDALGLVPIYCYGDDEQVIVSTDADWLVTQLPRRPGINRRRLMGFMVGSMDQGRDDFVEGIFRVRPGEMATWVDSNVPRFSRTWDPPTLELSGDEASEGIMSVLREILDQWAGPQTLVAMSGGLDSSLLAGLLAEQRGADPQNLVDVAVMLTPWLARGDERKAVEALLRALPLRAQGFSVDEHWPLKSLKVFGDHLAMGPQFHPEETYVLAFHHWLREQFGSKEILYGNGADDVLWCPGYVYRRGLIAQGRYREALFDSRSLHQFVRTLVGSIVEGHAWGEPLLRSLRERNQGPSHGVVQELPWRDPSNWVCPIDGWRGDESWVPPGTTWREQRLLRLQTWKWELVCRTLNREARRAGVQGIFPMLDREFWDLCLNVGTAQLVEGGRQKAVLRQGARTILPDDALRRQKHGGFDALVEYGLTVRESDRIYEIFSNSALGRRGLIDRERFFDAYDSYREADPMILRRPYLGSLAIWQTIAAELWLSNW